MTLSANQTQQFAATVTGLGNTAVTWSISPSVGTISNTGLYTAPAGITTQQSVTVTATSVADGSKCANATVMLVPAVNVTLSPASATLAANQNQQFTASVTGGPGNTQVRSSVSPSVGTISKTGLYTAPASITTQQTVTVKATSVADATKSANATVTLQAPASGLVAAYVFSEGTGTTVADASDKGFTGTIQNAVWTTAGKYGNALVFNGSNALVTIPNAAALQLTTAMTLEAWVNPSKVTSSWRDVIYKGNDNYYLEGTTPSPLRP